MPQHGRDAEEIPDLHEDDVLWTAIDKADTAAIYASPVSEAVHTETIKASIGSQSSAMFLCLLKKEDKGIRNLKGRLIQGFYLCLKGNRKGQVSRFHHHRNNSRT